MTVRLTVDEAAWRAHVAAVVAAVPGLVPVVKGNGYGFGRHRLARLAVDLTGAGTLAVGTVHELADVPDGVDATVLTPVVERPTHDVVARAILTVGAPEHVDALRGTGARVLVKLTSAMRRFGRGGELVEAARGAGLDVVGVSVHPPLAGDDAAHVRDVVAALEGVDRGLDAWVSHLSPEAARALPGGRRHRLRLGTALWHGDKSSLHLDADVLDARPMRAGTPLGYRQAPAATDGTVLVIGAGTAHGVHPLPDGRSPFHFERRRLALHEPPHMHVAMCVVPDGDPCPTIGDRVDVQRPLTTTTVDDVVWR